MKKIEHLGIAVKNLEEANKTYTKLFNQEPYKLEMVESEGVSTSFFMVGENKIELLEATNPDSAIAKYIEKKGEGSRGTAGSVEHGPDGGPGRRNHDQAGRGRDGNHQTDA